MDGHDSPSKTWTSTAKVLLLALLAGCSPFGSPVPGDGRPVREVYNEMEGTPESTPLSLSPHPEAGKTPRLRPILYPAKVMAVYVREHVDTAREMKIGSHYVYFLLREASFTEQPIDREPPDATSLDHPEEKELLPLRRVFSRSSMQGSLIPYQAARLDDTLRSPTPSTGYSLR